MPRDEQRKLMITFAQSLPMGTRGTFTHDGELWIAYPATKNQRIIGLLDRLVGAHKRISTEMVNWVNDWPDDAKRVVRVLSIVNSALMLHNELIMEKAEAVTM